MEKYGELEDAPEIRCPMCGKECDTFFECDGNIVGCDRCIKEVEAYNTEEEYF
jgi:hypothetical protein